MKHLKKMTFVGRWKLYWVRMSCDHHGIKCSSDSSESMVFLRLCRLSSKTSSARRHRTPFFVPRVRWDPSSLPYQWSELGGSDLLGRERRAPPAGDQPKRSYHDMLIPLSLSLMSHVVKSRHKLSINLLPFSSSSTIPSFTNLPTPLPPLSFRLPSSAAFDFGIEGESRTSEE